MMWSAIKGEGGRGRGEQCDLSDTSDMVETDSMSGQTSISCVARIRFK